MCRQRYCYMVSLLVVIMSVFIIACGDITAKDNNGKASENSVNGQQYSGNYVKEHGNGYVKKNGDIHHKPSLANPAATRCIDDGYVLEPIVENGIIVDHICINPETGMKCEVWKYFRNECKLEP